MCFKDILLRPFAYNFDIFPTYSNLRHISHKDISPAFDTVSTITTPSVLHYYPIHFSSNLKSLPTTSNISPLPGFEVPPNNIISLSFDFIIHSFASELISWYGSIVQYYMLEKILCIFALRLIYIFIPLFTLLPATCFYRLHGLHHCSPLKSVLAPRLKPCTYRVLRFFPKHQSCHYVHDCHTLTIWGPTSKRSPRETFCLNDFLSQNSLK